MDIDTTIRRAKAKDPKALNDIYTMYYPEMARVCTNIVKGDKDIVNDLVHDAFVLAFASLDQLRDNERFLEWLTAIVRNVAIKHIARKKRLHLVPLSQINSNNNALSSESLTDSNINLKDIIELVSQLPEGYGKVFRLYAIEGFSHKEIGEMLGIKPHSSSSQFSRAKSLLKRMFAGGGIIAILSVLLYHLITPHSNEPVVSKIKPKDNKRNVAEVPITQKRHEDEANKKTHSINKSLDKPDTVQYTSDTVVTPSCKNIQEPAKEPREIAETYKDTTAATPEDSMLLPVNNNIQLLADDGKPTKKKWKLLVAGSFGPALAQNTGKRIAIGHTGDIDSEGPAPIFPESVNTWEDYSRYLHMMEHENTTTDTIALIDIADHNHGDIVEKEKHDKPVTFGISFNKTLNGRWSMETGILYSLLNSHFVMGDNGYVIMRKQQAHYIGVPIRLSYRLIGYDNLSAYTSTGFTLHVPVYGKMNSNYMVNWHTAYSESRHFSPPFQWQTGISIGLQYKFTPHTSIFVEPTLNWFIPSGSDTHTIWTEHPVMFTSLVGIRLTW